ncbi:hypothetical protein DFH28DRAFT_922356 [Melampsora americana]|nr:hypothetical protein DFH28DRAFT_922356 [Melampsora americana]
MPRLSKSNYLEAMEDIYSVEGFLNPVTEKEEVGLVNGEQVKVPKKRSRVLDGYLEELADELVFVYDLFYNDKFGDDGYYFGSDYFDLDRAKSVVENIDQIRCEDDIKGVMGGDIIKGGVKVVFKHIIKWRTQDKGLHYQQKRSNEIEMAKKKRKSHEEKLE